jgi:hypothetical protein
MPTSGRPRDQFLRTFSAFSRLVAVFGLLFQRPFSLSLVDRSIYRSINCPATKQIQSRKFFNPVPKKKKEKKRPKLVTMAS